MLIFVILLLKIEKGERMPLQPIAIKSSGKQERELKVLLGLIEHYIKTGKPVGSNTLKEAGFGTLSSATIRNYFANLEDAGYLIQLHSSGGRIPTEKAYRYYATESLASHHQIPQINDEFVYLKGIDTQEISSYLYHAAERLSHLSNTAVFISSPRFDHDFVLDVRVVGIDAKRLVCILVTNFGAIHTEILYTDHRLSNFAIKRIESYFQWRLNGINKPDNLEKAEEQLAQKFYNEVMVRYIVGYSHYNEEEIFRTGFSKLLNYPDFETPASLANGLGLFENNQGMRLLLKECEKLEKTRFWIGNDLLTYTTSSPNCAVIASPYKINQKIVGAVGLLGPMRIPYRELFEMLNTFSTNISEALTRNLYKFKITFRQPHENTPYLDQPEQRILRSDSSILLEDKRKGE